MTNFSTYKKRKAEKIQLSLCSTLKIILSAPNFNVWLHTTSLLWLLQLSLFI